MTLSRWARLLAGLALILPPAASASALYGVKDLGSLGGDRSGSTGLSADAHVVGYSAVPGEGFVHGFVAGPAGMLDLGTLGGDQSLARDINRSGDVVGWAFTSTGERHAFLYRGGALEDLGTLGTAPVDAWAISDDDRVVGSYELDNHERAYVWQNGTMTDLGTLGGTDSRAYDINVNGDICGFARPLDNSQIHACLWQGGVPTDLGTLGGWASQAYDLNDYGKVVGWTMEVPNQISHGFVWTNGTLVDLGSLGGEYSAAFAVNNRGEVVGASTDASEQQRAVYCVGGPPWIDLNALIDPNAGWLLLNANDINEQGQIVGVGLYYGEEHAYLLTPLPALSVDPTAMSLEFLGAAPNPGPAGLRLRFTLPAPGHVTLRLFDVSGRAVRTLADATVGAGPRSLAWDGRDDSGAALGAGLYWAEFRCEARRFVARVTLLR
ncbi:MAG TPA: FlgD immunoglobulin-like domain containing protein [Candidatus Saccharimonadaceae bacterium]|jgi:probable HAF family extracellular repeat protein|nr:FlgD immunoglobulin-like domain containing protein [Candidatus Saccharimonadaceae bacterium]